MFPSAELGGLARRFVREVGDGVFHLCPAAGRFRLARHLAQKIEPHFRRRGYGQLPPNYVDDFRAYLLGRVLRRLHLRDRTFKSEITVQGAEFIGRDCAILLSRTFC